MIRTYTGLDFIDYVAAFISNTGTNIAVENSISPMNFAITSSGSNNPFGAGFRSSVDYVYQASGNLDFDVFPAIPDNALISSVEVRIDLTLSASGTATDSAGDPFTCIVDGIFNSSVIVDGGDCIDIKMTESNSDSDPASASASVSGSDHYSNFKLFDFSGSPITKTELITRFTSWLVQLDGIWTSDGFNPGSSGESSGFTFSGIRITITYVSGPEIFTISPAGGNVQVGQVLTVTGPGAANLDYAALTGLGVIPIEPKIINENEVDLEIPYPATDPCYDCFPSCPDCDAAFTPCDENFESEACQEAIQACLDCLIVCLEDLQLAEECQESSQNPPNVTVPIEIIVGTQFSGSVTLGNFVIITADGSGLYKFALGQTHDELYASNRDGSTYNVKIPNPGGKTGFFRS